jgi:hypothetical protein
MVRGRSRAAVPSTRWESRQGVSRLRRPVALPTRSTSSLVRSTFTSSGFASPASLGLQRQSGVGFAGVPQTPAWEIRLRSDIEVSLVREPLSRWLRHGPHRPH